jgi:hypothetical protein
MILGMALIDITCDVIAALADQSFLQNRSDVMYAADWIGGNSNTFKNHSHGNQCGLEGLTIALSTSIPPKSCLERITSALMTMVDAFGTFDCFSEPAKVDPNLWKSNQDFAYRGIIYMLSKCTDAYSSIGQIFVSRSCIF